MLRGATTIFAFISALLPAFAQEKAATPGQSAVQPAAAKPPRPPCGIRTPELGWHAEARFIAGMDGTKFTDSMTPEQKVAWHHYSRAGGADWKRVKSQYLDRIDDWRKTSLAGVPTGTAFYPFSGPDAANVLRFFPDAREYLMIGLEPVGCIPTNPSDFAATYWPNLRQSLQSVVAMGFFKTDDMRKDFSADGVEGVLPALLFLVARSGYTVTDVMPVMIGADGRVVAAGPARAETRGVTIKFEDEKRNTRALTYFSLNLQDSSLKRKPGTVQYLSGLPKPATLVKSASYLMHKKYFSTIREVILSRSVAIVEDDSGIPYRFFDKSVWDVRLYGRYTKPIQMFDTWFQEDLKSAFTADEAKVEALEFGIGYKYRPKTSTLILARRRG